MKAISILTVACFLMGCSAGLKVKVDSFDMAAFKRSKLHLEPLVVGACAEVERYMSATYEDQVVEAYRKETTLMMTAAKERTDNPAFTTALLDAAVSNVVANYKRSLANSRSFLAPIQGNCSALPGDADALNTLWGRQQAALERFRKNELAFQDAIVLERVQVAESLDVPTATALKLVEPLKTITTQATNSIPRTLFGGGVVADEHISLIVRADERFWSRYKRKCTLDVPPLNNYKASVRKARINKVRVGAFMGNADLAIKMDSPGVFTIKGVRVDADAAVAAMATVAQQGVKYLAYASGIPVPDPASGGGTENTMRSIPEVEENATLQLQLESTRERNSRHLRAYLAAIRSRVGLLRSSNADTRKRALEEIKLAFDGYRQALTPTNVSN